MKLTSLPNPSAGIDAVMLRTGAPLLVYNHTEDARSPLNVAVSSDGKLWKAALAIEDQPGEYSYPSVIQTRDGLVHVTYTWKRERIKHVVIDPRSWCSVICVMDAGRSKIGFWFLVSSFWFGRGPRTHDI